MGAKEPLKRVFYGALISVPPKIPREGLATAPVVPLRSDQPVRDYKILYAIARPRVRALEEPEAEMIRSVPAVSAPATRSK